MILGYPKSTGIQRIDDLSTGPPGFLGHHIEKGINHIHERKLLVNNIHTISRTINKNFLKIDLNLKIYINLLKH